MSSEAESTDEYPAGSGEWSAQGTDEYPPGSGEWSAQGTDEYPPGSGEWSAQGTDEYPPGSGEYFSRDEESISGADGPDGPDGVAAPEPFWKRGGWDSFGDYMAELRRKQALIPGSGPPMGGQVPEVELPGAEVGDIGRPRLPERRLRQVNVKLRVGEAGDLDHAARIYGLAPSTLARLLVNRGVRAILDRET